MTTNDSRLHRAFGFPPAPTSPPPLTALQNRVTELEAALRFATQCSEFHAATAERARAHSERLWYAAKASEGRKPQNDLLRDLWRRERQKRQAESVRIVYRNTIEDFLGGMQGHTLEEVLMRTSDLEGVAR
jgi:hypothetical protein